MKQVFIDTSAITQDALGYLRDKNTDIRLFRYYADRIAFSLMHFALTEKDLKDKKIERQWDSNPSQKAFVSTTPPMLLIEDNKFCL